MEVRNNQNEKLGNVQDMVVDLNTGKISYVVLGVGGFLGIGEKYIAVPPAAFAKGADDGYVLLNADKAKLQNAPGFVKTDWPSVDNPTFNDYWKENVGGVAGTVTGTGSSSSSSSSLNRDTDRDNLRSERRDAHTYHGRITTVDANARTITVEGANGSETFHVGDKARLNMRNNKKAMLGDFKVGETVTVGYHDQGGEHMAHMISGSESIEQK
jgi:hypothetical protein